MEDLQMLQKNWIYKRGDIYLADLGTPAGSVQGGVRPVINIQNNTGSLFWSDTDCDPADNGT